MTDINMNDNIPVISVKTHNKLMLICEINTILKSFDADLSTIVYVDFNNTDSEIDKTLYTLFHILKSVYHYHNDHNYLYVPQEILKHKSYLQHIIRKTRSIINIDEFSKEKLGEGIRFKNYTKKEQNGDYNLIFNILNFGILFIFLVFFLIREF